jgi:exodeoxyribonuclease V alpha subunit
MIKTNNIHHQFASFFNDITIWPFAFLISKKLADGHICIKSEEIYEFELETDAKNIEIKLTSLEWEVIKNHPLVAYNVEDFTKPFHYCEGALYLTRYYKYETNVINKINALIQKGKNGYEDRIKKLKKINFNIEVNENLINYQSLAKAVAYLNNFTIITGGPGTGKTTTIANLIQILCNENGNLKFGFAAPTGKASQRMEESLINNEIISNNPKLRAIIEKSKPITLHSLLGNIRNSPFFKYNSENKLPQDVLIIDEASMIDIAMFSKLLDAVKEDARIIFLGDKNQLSSVDAGSIFGDLCTSVNNTNAFSDKFCDLLEKNFNVSISKNSQHESIADSIVELKHSYRFPIESQIGKLSKVIIDGDKPGLQEIINTANENNGQIKFISDDYDLAIIEFKKHFESVIEKEELVDALNQLNNAKILCAVKEGKSGVYELNKKIEKSLSIPTQKEFYKNRPILVTKNYKDLNLFNGDIGLIRDENKVWFLRMENNKPKPIGFEPALIAESETVYAMTIHKSQGSEYNNVMVVLPQKEDNKLLSQELLYTAITRTSISKEEMEKKDQRTALYVVANQKVLNACLDRKVERSSGLITRINKK